MTSKVLVGFHEREDEKRSRAYEYGMSHNVHYIGDAFESLRGGACAERVGINYNMSTVE